MNPVTAILFPKFQSLIEKLQEWAHPDMWVYDIETYPNFFSCAMINAKTLECRYYELSPYYNNINDFIDFLHWLSVQNGEMVGFNNQHFDWPVVNRIFKLHYARVDNVKIFEFVQAIFSADFEDRFKHVIWPKDQFIKQIDLFKINHYDNVNKSTSLKVLENNMGMDNIQELPIKPGQNIQPDEVQPMRDYNWHDGAATLLFLAHNMAHIDLRRNIGEKYNHDFTNASEAKIGSDIFKLELQKAGLSVYDKTYRSEIDFNECVFPYVCFERSEFREVLNWLKSTTVTGTKEVLNDIEVPWSLAQYMNPDEVIVHGLSQDILSEMKLRKGAKVKLSLVPPCTLMTGCVFIADHLHVVVDGFQFDFGTGGIHGSIAGSIIKTTATHKLIDVDVASYYPNLGIKNRIYPEHLGPAFCNIYEGIYIERGNYPKKTHFQENYAIKIALNAAYGNSNSQYSFLYDPKYTMTITLNGQLLLCMLAEQLMKVPGLTLVQINTDGVTYHCPNEYVEHTMNLCRWWESFTGLELEDVNYKAMYIRDVNNYIAVDETEEIKSKGAYKHDLAKNGEWHKNFSSLIIAMGAEEALLYGRDPKEYIDTMFKPENYHLFCMLVKVKRDSELVYVGEIKTDVPVQRTTRYYASKTNGRLIKVMKPTPATVKLHREGDHYQHESTGAYEVKKPGTKPTSGRYKPVPEHMKRAAPDRRNKVEATCNISVCNNMDNFIPSDVDLNWYVDEINKLVEPLLN